MSQYWRGKHTFKDLRIIEGGSLSFNESAGRTYYVNNITGGSGNDGLSWSSAFDQLSTAITAHATYLATQSSGNEYVRNRIFIQGTSTRYSAISTMPSYCEVIGVGATPFGNGAGIAAIGSANAADGMAGSTRGSDWYNLQFSSGGVYYAVDLAVAYRTKFELCGFGGAADNTACAIAFNVVSGSGLIMRDCKTLAHAAFPVIGYAFATAGGNFNECLIERCYANASTTGMANAGYLNNGTVIQDNICYGGTSGIADTSAQTGDGALAFYYRNFASGATNGITMTNSPERHCMNNYSIGNATSLIYYALGS